MIRTKEYKVFITQNLRNSENFIVLNDDEIITIQKDNGHFLSPYFKCTTVADYTDDIVDLFIDKIVYNYFTKELNLMNTRNQESPVCSKIILRNSDIASLYTFGPEGILIIINREEK